MLFISGYVRSLSSPIVYDVCNLPCLLLINRNVASLPLLEYLCSWSQAVSMTLAKVRFIIYALVTVKVHVLPAILHTI